MPGQQPKITLIFFVIGILLYLTLLSFIQYPLTTVLKPIPILLLMLVTLKSKAIAQTKALLLTALGYSFLGDIVLTLPLKGALQGGIILFMLTHCAYIILYLKDFRFQANRFLYFLPVLALVMGGFYYLLPYLGAMTMPVTLYLCLLSTMVFCAFQVRQHARWIISGACLFLLCDFAFAINHFVLPDNKAIAIFVMLVYYIAQFLLVTGLSRRGLCQQQSARPLTMPSAIA